MNIETEIIELSLTAEAVKMLRAFTKARNGSFDNQADAAIRRGIASMVEASPAEFQRSYERNLST